jgi:hypothetical protein
MPKPVTNHKLAATRHQQITRLIVAGTCQDSLGYTFRDFGGTGGSNTNSLAQSSLSTIHRYLKHAGPNFMQRFVLIKTFPDEREHVELAHRNGDVAALVQTFLVLACVS